MKQIEAATADYLELIGHSTDTSLFDFSEDGKGYLILTIVLVFLALIIGGVVYVFKCRKEWLIEKIKRKNQTFADPIENANLVNN